MQITPPRTGTFIYHTHLHDFRQLSVWSLRSAGRRRAGRERSTPAVDHVLIVAADDGLRSCGAQRDSQSIELPVVAERRHARPGACGSAGSAPP